MKEMIFPHNVKDHKLKDYTWELDDMQIEDKIKELRKEIYHLQNCRKNQPNLIIFRKENFETGEEVLDIFHGWAIINLEKGLYCADYWNPATLEEIKYIEEHYKLSEEGKNKLEKAKLKVSKS